MSRLASIIMSMNYTCWEFILTAVLILIVVKIVIDDTCNGRTDIRRTCHTSNMTIPNNNFLSTQAIVGVSVNRIVVGRIVFQ